MGPRTEEQVCGGWEVWEARPSQYHVVFFDTMEKVVTWAWVSDKRMERLVFTDKKKRAWNERLPGAMKMARQAGREDLEARRRKFCLAARFKSPWGPVWPGWGREEDDYEDHYSDETMRVIMKPRKRFAGK